VIPCDPKLAIFVLLGAMNWVPKWFKPSGAWKSDQLTLALSQLFERVISSSPAPALPRDVGTLPTRATPQPSRLTSLAQYRRAPKNSRASQDNKKIKAGGKP
jgi:TetR/AcrR family transcriptional regulator